jgi:hypothetical protein
VGLKIRKYAPTLPFHGLVFGGMQRHIARAAEG